MLSKFRSSQWCALAAVMLLALNGWQRVRGNEVPRVVVFDFELIDTSLEGEISGQRPDEQQRLRLISDLLRQKLSESGRYLVLDQKAVADQVADAGYLYGCNGCEASIALALGADLAIIGTVQKVSNLILNINLYLDEVETNERKLVASVDIRGNTDESWSRGVRYLVKRRVLKE